MLCRLSACASLCVCVWFYVSRLQERKSDRKKSVCWFTASLTETSNVEPSMPSRFSFIIQNENWKRAVEWRCNWNLIVDKEMLATECTLSIDDALLDWRRRSSLRSPHSTHALSSELSKCLFGQCSDRITAPPIHPQSPSPPWPNTKSKHMTNCCYSWTWIWFMSFNSIDKF